jgi:hypothetical protein
MSKFVQSCISIIHMIISILHLYLLIIIHSLHVYNKGVHVLTRIEHDKRVGGLVECVIDALVISRSVKVRNGWARPRGG